MSDKMAEQLDEIMGMSFGDYVPEADMMLVNLHVRSTQPGGTVKEGTRPPIFLAVSIIEELHEQLPQVLALMADAGLDKDVLPPSTQPVPAWDAGPTMRDITFPALCSAFGFRPPDESSQGMVAVIGISPVGQGAASESMADYLVSHRTMVALRDSIAKVVDKLRSQRSRPPKKAPRRH